MKKLLVLVLHGTWGGGSEWKDPGSEFEQRLRHGLDGAYDTIRFDPIPWNGKNRWRARDDVAKKLDERLADHGEDDAGRWEYLVIAHSHGGNIATEAVRERMRKDPHLPVRGVVCLNTPFLKHELRASSGYLTVWLCITLGMIAALTSLVTNVTAVTTPVLFESIRLKVGIDLHARELNFILIAISAVLLSLVMLSRRMHHDRESGSKDSWGPRPEVLCLSCPDDEAITFLGLAEGIANLPQLLLHPIALVFSTSLTVLLLATNGSLSWCAAEVDCWAIQAHFVTLSFVAWVLVAFIGGVLGSISISLLFGLSFAQTVENLVSRVLVAYVPLRPANSHFRGVSDISLKWTNPIQLFHSQIFRSPKATEEICDWLKFHAKKLPSAEPLIK